MNVQRTFDFFNRHLSQALQTLFLMLLLLLLLQMLSAERELIEGVRWLALVAVDAVMALLLTRATG